MDRPREGFTLVETLIVVLILAILAMAVAPEFATSSQDARDAALVTDLQTVRQQLLLYKEQHNGRYPLLDPSGQQDTGSFVDRLTSRTAADGAIENTGQFGPYLTEWPSNPFCDAAVAQKINFGKLETSPRDGTSGWYFSTRTSQIYVNSKDGATSMD